MKKTLIGILALGLLAGCSSNNASSGTTQQKQKPPKQEAQQTQEQTQTPSKAVTSQTDTTTPPQQSTNTPSVSKTTTVTAPQPSQPNTTPIPQHNTEADIANDVAVIKSKAALAVSNEQGWVPIINKVPDATVPDGFGGMLYAWNVILDGNGDGSAQQIYFFDNDQYLGTDTKGDHLQSSVRPESTGEIIATYGHYLPNDIMADPTGQPYIVTFHWNGSRLIPDSVATLNEAVNNQFK